MGQGDNDLQPQGVSAEQVGLQRGKASIRRVHLEDDLRTEPLPKQHRGRHRADPGGGRVGIDDRELVYAGVGELLGLSNEGCHFRATGSTHGRDDAEFDRTWPAGRRR